MAALKPIHDLTLGDNQLVGSVWGSKLRLHPSRLCQVVATNLLQAMNSQCHLSLFIFRFRVIVTYPFSVKANDEHP